MREDEGPFGEFPKYYSAKEAREVIEIDRITHRRDPLFHTIIPAEMEHLLLGAIPREATLLSHLQRTFPGVTDVHLAVGGVCRYHLYVQMKKRREGEPKNVILGAFGAHYDIKQVVVVDEDVDIHNPIEVEWAVATRFQADRDLVVVSRRAGLDARSLDHGRRAAGPREPGHQRQDGPRRNQAAGLRGPRLHARTHSRGGRRRSRPRDRRGREARLEPDPARMTGSAKRWVGASVERKEDARLLTGRGRFMDDLAPVAGLRHAADPALAASACADPRHRHAAPRSSFPA